jgi:alpha-glucosidase (family GH31 glycosyl hydrolase)
MYTCLWEVSAYSGTCIDPLFYYYPNDDNVYNDISASFMVGGALLVTPVLEGQDPQNITAYLPQGKWVNLGSVNRDVNGDDTKGSNVVLNA